MNIYSQFYLNYNGQNCSFLLFIFQNVLDCIPAICDRDTAFDNGVSNALEQEEFTL